MNPPRPRPLSGPSQRPASGGKPRQLVILLHGLGADGNDLIGLAPYWAKLLPDAEFLAPNAPFPCDMAPFGYQWFSFQSRELDAIEAGVRAAAPPLDVYIDEALAARGLSERELALVGFSQGTMMALHVGLRRADPVAGIVGYSGALIGGAALPGEIRSRPPVLLIHGEADEIVPVGAMSMAERTLKAAGISVATLSRPGLPHSIDEEGLRRGGAFLREKLLGGGVTGVGGG
jgi:phospholipase/carboxylesterase